MWLLIDAMRHCKSQRCNKQGCRKAPMVARAVVMTELFEQLAVIVGHFPKEKEDSAIYLPVSVWPVNGQMLYLLSLSQIKQWQPDLVGLPYQWSSCQIGVNA